MWRWQKRSSPKAKGAQPRWQSAFVIKAVPCGERLTQLLCPGQRAQLLARQALRLHIGPQAGEALCRLLIGVTAPARGETLELARAGNAFCANCDRLLGAVAHPDEIGAIAGDQLERRTGIESGEGQGKLLPLTMKPWIPVASW